MSSRRLGHFSSSVSPGLNVVRGAHDAEQQSARPGAGRMSREGARRNVRPDAPNKNYTIKHNTLIVNKRQTIRFVLLQCYVLYAAHWLPYTVVYAWST